MKRAPCPRCGREVAVRTDGTLYRHLTGFDARGRQVACPASGELLEFAREQVKLLGHLAVEEVWED